VGGEEGELYMEETNTDESGEGVLGRGQARGEEGVVERGHARGEVPE
jgi:hypothetical protein